MTDPLNPNHQEPAEGPRDGAFSSDAGAETTYDPTASASGVSAKASDVFETIRDAVGDLAEKAAPTVREISAKAAELVAVAADKAVPLVHKAGEATADASGKLAEKSRTWAADLRESIAGTADDKPAAADDAARENPPL